MRLEIKSLAMNIDGNVILHDINVSVENHEFVGIIGPNGSGKSTFLKCIYRVLRPTMGNIYIDGIDINDMSYQESALKIAVVAQNNFYSFDFPVLDIVLMGRFPHKGMLERDNPSDYDLARKALGKVGLADLEKRSFLTLSGGEQQRVFLARALVQETECMILDEPMNQLDIKYQLQIMNIVKNLNLTIITAVHDLNIAAMYCDRLIALRNGKIVGNGSPAELLTEGFIYDLYGVRVKVDCGEDTKYPNIKYLAKRNLP